MARGLLLAFTENEAGQVPGVLPPDTEVGLDVVAREPCAEAIQAVRPGLAISLEPAGQVRSRRGRRKSAGVGSGRDEASMVQPIDLSCSRTSTSFWRRAP